LSFGILRRVSSYHPSLLGLYTLTTVSWSAVSLKLRGFGVRDFGRL
jgi:hypothetical protein